MKAMLHLIVALSALGISAGEPSALPPLPVLHPHYPPTCGSNIYCHGRLLHTVQLSKIFPDSKTFVDMKMRYPKNETLLRFERMMNSTLNDPTVADVRGFVESTFDPAGSEFDTWCPGDWTPEPGYLAGVRDRSLADWGRHLHTLWKSLGRKMKDEVRDNQESYSIIYVPHPVVVPGGRFREFYYWDSYWIVRGLLLSEMNSTVKGMLENFVSVVQRYGFVPNGGRIYYSMRSQPPLLIPMVDSYLEFTGDIQFLTDNVAMLEKEFNFWMNNRTVEVVKGGKPYRLAVYRDSSSGPRPESYREDLMSANFYQTDEDREAFFSELKSAAESGWDFSSRWFVVNGTDQGNLTNLHVKQLVPVDLNSILSWNAGLLSKFHTLLGNVEKAEEYSKIARDWGEAIGEVLWNDQAGCWLDFDRLNGISRNYFYPSNLAPLWTGSFDPAKKPYYVSRIVKYLERTKVFQNVGGLPTSQHYTGEQWDFPNAWPPLQYIAIMALDSSEDVTARELAYALSEKWVRSNFKAFNDTKAMFEKYDATVLGAVGGGGEYEVQLGFGWTNGIIMELLWKFGDRLTAREAFGTELLSAGSAALAGFAVVSHAVTVLSAFVVTTSAGCIGLAVYSRRHPTKYIRLPQFYPD